MKELFERDTWQEIFGSISKNRVRTIITKIGVLWGIFIFINLSGTEKCLTKLKNASRKLKKCFRKLQTRFEN